MRIVHRQPQEVAVRDEIRFRAVGAHVHLVRDVVVLRTGTGTDTGTGEKGQAALKRRALLTAHETSSERLTKHLLL